MSAPTTGFPRVQSANLDGRANVFRHKERELLHLYGALTKSAKTIKLAIQADSDLTSAEADFEFVLALSELKLHYKTLSMQKDLQEIRRFEKGKSHAQRSRPVGIVYIIPSNQSVFFSIISALTAVVTAGCCIVLEVS
jgi:acyl-CoA reductase-like NAD-dependent aldehyde dehydrogenase